MATFLELCVRVAEESGTGAAPSAVTGQTGRSKKIVNWVRDAWTKVQNLHPNWRFLYAEFSAALADGDGTYSDTDWTLTRFGEWVGGHRSLSIYDPDIGRADESYLRQITYDAWRERWDFGEQDENRPTEYAFAPDNTIRFGATPDAIYTVRGTYLKTPQILAADGDTPDLPARFHDIILRRALMLLAEHDEAINAMQLAAQEFGEMLFQMERDLLPPINVRGMSPIA